MLSLLTQDIAGLSRIDPSTFTDQQMMECFFTPNDFEAARASFGGDEDDACSWKCVECDDFSHIVDIDWNAMDIYVAGSINFQMIPRNLTFLTLQGQELIGEVDTTSLPVNLQFFCIQQCLFTGTLDLSRLPQGLTDFFVTENKISGLSNFYNFSYSLRTLSIEEEVQGSVYISKLPITLFDITLHLGCSAVLAFEDESDRDRVRV